MASVKSEEVLSLNYGKALRNGIRRNGTVPVYGTNGQCGWHDKPLTSGPGVILGRKGQGPLGVEWCESDFWVIDTAYFVTRKTEQLDLKYFYHLAKYIGLNHLKDGTSNPGLSRDTFADLLLPLPPLVTQRRIGHILGTLDDKIELNRRMNETLEAMARAIFKSWFVDFLPVRAKAAARTQTGAPVLPKHIADLFPDCFEDSELGEIPTGWKVGPILKQAKLLSGGTPKTDRKEYWDGDVLWASAKDVSQCGQTFLIRTQRSITQKGLQESATQLIPAFCVVVVARGATTGRLVMFGREMTMNQTCYALASTFDTPFSLYCCIQHEMDQIVHAAHGSVFDTITTSTFAHSKVVLPPVLLLKVFDQRVAPMFHRILGNIEESQTLGALRDTLLPKLLSGELRARELDDLAEDRHGI